MPAVPVEELRRAYRRRTPIETLVAQRPDGQFFLRFVFKRGGREFHHDADPFAAADDRAATEIAGSLQYDVLNGDLLETLNTHPEVAAARAALEAKIATVLDDVAPGTPDVVSNRTVEFAKDTLQPLLVCWAVTAKNAYRPKYEPEVTNLIDTVNRVLDATHPAWRTLPG